MVRPLEELIAIELGQALSDELVIRAYVNRDPEGNSSTEFTGYLRVHNAGEPKDYLAVLSCPFISDQRQVGILGSVSDTMEGLKCEPWGQFHKHVAKWPEDWQLSKPTVVVEERGESRYALSPSNIGFFLTCAVIADRAGCMYGENDLRSMQWRAAHRFHHKLLRWLVMTRKIIQQTIDTI